MMSYVRFSVSLHGLDFKSSKELDDLAAKIKSAVAAIHPALRFDDDVEVEIDEHSGMLECDNEVKEGNDD